MGIRRGPTVPPQAKAEREPADRTFGFLVHDVSRLVKRRFDRRARQTGLPITRRQAAVVLYVARHEGVSQAEVANWLDIEPIALVRMLDKLHDEGLVERRAHPTDRRVRTLWLAPGAPPVVERILDINQAIREEAFAGAAPGTRDALIDALAGVKENLMREEEAVDENADLASEPTGEPLPGRAAE
jgi:MarR family transcriptional regulator, transcriptional regulator for hemolysin